MRFFRKSSSTGTGGTALAENASRQISRTRAFLQQSASEKSSSTKSEKQLSQRLTRLEQRLTQLELALFESRDDGWKRSRGRWETSKPTEGLTWGEFLSGDAFIEKARSYDLFGPAKRIVEIGPGYGRLVQSLISLEIPLASYTGIDISAANVGHLTQKFGDKRFKFIEGDAEVYDFGGNIDGVFSSATMHHFFPTNQKLIENLGSHMTTGGRLVFDVPEGDRAFFESDGQTFIRWYTKERISNILSQAGFRLVAVDEVNHRGTRDHPRLLVVAEKL